MTVFKNSDQLNQALPKCGGLLALDLGTKKIGVASCNEARFMATPKAILFRHGDQKDFLTIKKIFDESKASAIVIGLSLNMDGSNNEMTKFCEKFARNFDEFLQYKVPIFLFDERLTSFEARRIITSQSFGKRSKKDEDDVAACVILESFLESQ